MRLPIYSAAVVAERLENAYRPGTPPPSDTLKIREMVAST